ncbi:MAG: cytochrome c oxidase subunit II [Janthinobacterium lividum]
MSDFAVLPQQLGRYSILVDGLFWGLMAVAVATIGLVFFLMARFVARYREDSIVDRESVEDREWKLEIGWTAGALVVFVGLALWGARLYILLYEPPRDALEIRITGKQWMWKASHEGGQRELGDLHVPVGRPVKLVMASEDVIHSFFVPALRIKHDVVPGRYETMWFDADRPGDYRILCAEYCGTAHAEMGGWLHVMRPADYAAWLATQSTDASLVTQGAALFKSFGCSGCHGGSTTVRAPSLNGIYGRPVPLADGSTVTADERYLRDSVLLPKSEVVAGFVPVMPSYAGVISEDELARIIVYLKATPRA